MTNDQFENLFQNFSKKELLEFIKGFNKLIKKTGINIVEVDPHRGMLLVDDDWFEEAKKEIVKREAKDTIDTICWYKIEE